VTELFGGPFLVSDRSELIAAARRTAALTRSDERLSPEEHHAAQRAMAEQIQKLRDGPATIRELLDPSRPTAASHVGRVGFAGCVLGLRRWRDCPIRGDGLALSS
jgi:hypothetical protein